MRRSTSTFGLTTGEWDEAKAELRAAILKAAYQRRMTSYGEIAPQVTVTKLDPHSSLMNHLLGAIFEDEHAAGLPLLTSIVTHKDGDKEPGPGYYDQARKLGYLFPDPLTFWAIQVQEVFKVHGRPEPIRRRTT